MHLNYYQIIPGPSYLSFDDLGNLAFKELNGAQLEAAYPSVIRLYIPGPGDDEGGLRKARGYRPIKAIIICKLL